MLAFFDGFFFKQIRAVLCGALAGHLGFPFADFCVVVGEQDIGDFQPAKIGRFSVGRGFEHFGIGKRFGHCRAA